jgi:hypothetical protein
VSLSRLRHTCTLEDVFGCCLAGGFDRVMHKHVQFAYTDGSMMLFVFDHRDWANASRFLFELGVLCASVVVSATEQTTLPIRTV